jgi:hypothetical protein
MSQKLYSIAHLGALFLLLLLAGCRSEQVAFRFSPPHPVSQCQPATMADSTAVPRAPSAIVAGASAHLSQPSGKAVVSGRQEDARRRAQRRTRPLVALRQAGFKALGIGLVSSRRAHAEQPVAAGTAVSDRSGAERNSLFIGLLLGALGIGIILAVENQALAASTLLLNTAHVLLVLAALAMLIWFVLLVLRASKES